MALKHSPKKAKKNRVSAISVEGSRALEPQVDPHETRQGGKASLLNPKMLIIGSLVLIVIILLLSLPAVYFYNQYHASQLQKNPEEQVTELTAEVGKLILLPTGETPTIATVSDKSKLSGQSFFANAENGDKVLIYSNAKKAILYRPSNGKIIEVGPINITGDAGKPNAQVAGVATGSATLSPTPSLTRVGLLNGTSVVGLTKKIEASLTGKVTNMQVTVKENAAKNDYADTLVIVTNPSQKAAADQIAKALNAKVGSLPAWEVAPANTDITVILGKSNSQ